MASWRAPGSILKAPDSILEAPRLDLGGFWHDFFNIFGQDAKKAKNAKNACQNKTAITNPPRVGGRRCSPPGGFQLNKKMKLSMLDEAVFGSFTSQLPQLENETHPETKLSIHQL